MLQVRRLASQSVSPDQMGVFVGSGPKWSAATPPCEWCVVVIPLCFRASHTHMRAINNNNNNKTIYFLCSSNKPCCILLLWLADANKETWDLAPSEPRLGPFARASWPQHQARLPDFSSEPPQLDQFDSIWIVFVGPENQGTKASTPQIAVIEVTHGIAAWPSNASKSILPFGFWNDKESSFKSDGFKDRNNWTQRICVTYWPSE